MKVPDQFMQYFRKNYPGPTTIISTPDWHAPKIYRAAMSACGMDVLIEAAAFALSVLETNPVEMSERMAIEKLVAALEKIQQ